MQLIRLYPRHWRVRYEAEMLALLEARELGLREALDLVRGAMDARLHPPAPSILPPLASIAGGGLWTIVAIRLASEPVPADWPGFTLDNLPLASAAAICLVGALIGLVLRLGDLPARPTAGVALAIACGVAFVLALAAASIGMWYGAITGAAMTAAALGMAGVAFLLVRRGDVVLGTLALAAPLALLIPTTVAWIPFGLAWVLVGGLQLAGRGRLPGNLEAR